MKSGTEKKTGARMQKQTVMTFAQALLFIMYYTIFQAVLVAAAAPMFHHFFGVDVRWSGLLFVFGLLASCGPIFVALIYWSREARDRPGVCAIRFGVSLSAMVMLYVSAAMLSALRVGLPSVSRSALASYFVTVVLVVAPISSLTTYLMRRRRLESGRSL
jgi:hypothetical protein